MNKKNVYSQQIDALMMDIAGQRGEVREVIPQFRVSSMPYCPIRDFLFNQRSESFGMDFYTSIGTAVHETIQKWVIRGGYQDKVFCCWKAKETGEVIGPCFRRDIPKSWANYTILYEEITIKYNGLTGHIDLVLEVLPGEFIVVDFKTTDIQGKRRRYPTEWRDQYPASASSIIQISSYATLVRKLFKLNIVAWCLIYVDRSSKIRATRDYYKVMKPWNKKKHKRFLKHIDHACENNTRLEKLRKVMAKTNGYSTKANKLLNDIIIHRPCTDEDSYDEWMDYQFWKGYEEKTPQGVKNGACILKTACLKGNKACQKAVLSKL